MDTNDQNAIETEQLQKGLELLNNLAQEEYHEDLNSNMPDPTQQQERLLRIGRLLGVVLKEPFATAVPRDPTTSSTGAYRAWNLLDESAFNTPAKQTTWQYGVLESLCKEEGKPQTVYDFAHYLQYERSFFGYLAISTSKWICGDPALKQKIDTEVKASQQGGGAVQLISKGTLSTTVATLLVLHVPWLAVAGAPLIAGFVLLIICIGTDAFCEWAAHQELGQS